jgi:hypothetical protein
MASKKKEARKKAIRKTIKRINASVGKRTKPIAIELAPIPIKQIEDLNQRLEPCAREGCGNNSQMGDRLCKRHRIAMEESRARHR